MYNFVCLHCGKSFETKENDRKFCSVTCYNKSRAVKNKKCLHCGKEYFSYQKNRKYCSLQCAVNASKKTKFRICEQCGKNYKTKNNKQKYCSYECANEAQKIKRMWVCEYCGKEFERLRSDGEHHFCSKACANHFYKNKKNEYITNERYTIIKIKSKNIYFDCLVDNEDVNRLKNIYWNARIDNRHLHLTPYVEGRKNEKRVHLHRFIMNCPENFVVDHINGNTLDNRKCNLRICTQKENLQFKRKNN